MDDQTDQGLPATRVGHGATRGHKKVQVIESVRMLSAKVVADGSIRAYSVMRRGFVDALTTLTLAAFQYPMIDKLLPSKVLSYFRTKVLSYDRCTCTCTCTVTLYEGTCTVKVV